MSKSKPEDDWDSIHKYLRTELSDDAKLGALFREYVEESCHSSWEGFSTRDVTGIRRMLADMVIFHLAKG